LREKEERQNLTVRLPKGLREWLEAEAKKEMRPIANLIVKVLVEYKEKKEGERMSDGANTTRDNDKDHHSENIRR
jgi:hypothetical protein